MAHLEEQLLLIPEIRSSNPVIGKNLFIYWTFVYCQLCIEKTKIKKKGPGMAHFKKRNPVRLQFCVGLARKCYRILWLSQKVNKMSKVLTFLFLAYIRTACARCLILNWIVRDTISRLLLQKDNRLKHNSATSRCLRQSIELELCWKYSILVRSSKVW